MRDSPSNNRGVCFAAGRLDFALECLRESSAAKQIRLGVNLARVLPVDDVLGRTRLEGSDVVNGHLHQTLPCFER